MRQFAEQEIILPTGPFTGLRFNCSRQPFARLWLAATEVAEQNGWRRFAATGPSQTGKSLLCFVMPTLYHLFEVQETVILGLPSMDMAGDKWSLDILPVIQATRYRELLPRRGAGSRGGQSNLNSITFLNGKTLRFMSGGGDDKSRSAFTSRVAVITEADGLDSSSENSRETDKLGQIEARTQAFGDRARVYMECTTSIEKGRIHQEITKGTNSRIGIRCPHCRHYVTPEREHLVGWQGAEDEIRAGELSNFACPDCGEVWTEDERVAANHDCILIHSGQELTPDGTITGKPTRTETFGFRWNAANNLMMKTATIGRKEWKAARAVDSDKAEKELLQFWWARPYKDDKQDLTIIDANVIAKRVTKDPRGRLPSDAGRLTIGVDCGKRLCHWGALAWRPGASPHAVEYGRLEVASDTMGEEAALMAALRDFRDGPCTTGWPKDGGIERPTKGFFDAGWMREVVVAFCKDSREKGFDFWPCQGFGSARFGKMKKKRTTGAKVVAVGEGWEVVRDPDGSRVVEVDADRWKSWLHARLQTPIGQPGALTLFAPATSSRGMEHLSLAKHLTAEKKTEEFVAGEGLVTRWEELNRNNHWLDAFAMACSAGNMAGERLLGEPKPRQRLSLSELQKNAEHHEARNVRPQRPDNEHSERGR